MEVSKESDGRVLVHLDRHEARGLTEEIADAWYLKPMPRPLIRLVECLAASSAVYSAPPQESDRV